MKQYIYVSLVFMLAVVFCACGKMGKEQPSSLFQNDKNSQKGASTGAIDGLFGEKAFEQAEELVKEMSLEEKVGQMFLVSVNKRTEAVKQINNHKVGGVYLSEKNLKNSKRAVTFVSNLKKDISGAAIYIAVEEEGGGNHSISSVLAEEGTAETLTPMQMSTNMTVEYVKQRGLDLATELSNVGVNLNLGPVADIAAGKNVSYDMRCFGIEPESTAMYLEAMVTGMRQGKMAVTLKHFPGFGSATGDYTEEILNNEDSLMKLRTNDFSVYQAGIEAGADCVMVGSMAVSKITIEEIPAFLSSDIVTSLLREELGFDGVIMTPPLNQNVITKKYTSGYVAVEAVRAGCDMIVTPANFEESYEALLSEVRSGRLDEKVINTSVRRILQNKIERGILVLEDNN